MACDSSHRLLAVVFISGLGMPASGQPASRAQDSKIDSASDYSFTLTPYTPATHKLVSTSSTEPTTQASTQPSKMASIYEPLISILDKYSGNYHPDTWMLGDWGGERQRLVDNGIIFEASATQILQGNAHGGKDTNNAFRYSGSVDYYLKFDTARMNLWPGGVFLLHGETQFGQSINPKVGVLMQPNTDALFPVPGDSCATTLSEFAYVQALSEWLIVAAGKVDPTRLADTNVFANNERMQFLNLGLRNNPVILPYAPYTSMFAAAYIVPTEWLTILNAVVDTNSSANRTGFDTAFHSPKGATVAQEYDFTIKPFGLTGHQRFGWGWTSKDSRALGPDARIGLRGLTVVELALQRLGIQDVDTRPDDWAIWYNFDQWVYNEPEDPSQGIGVFGRFGWSTGKANFTEAFWSLGISSTGLIPTRDKDVLGLGYYYMDLSDGLRPFGLIAEQGVELFYSIEITPWLHITPDLQVIVDPGGSGDNDTAVVYGMRAQMSF